MRKVPLLSCLILLLMGVGIVSNPPLTGLEIMTRVNQVDRGTDVKSTVTMRILGAQERVRKITSFRHEVPDKVTQTILFFRAPANVKNTAFLTFDYDQPDKNDDQWMYLPALKKVKRIASTDKSGSFMGSDFAYQDLTTPDLGDYHYTIMKEVEVYGNPVWQILATPKDKKIIDETGYKQSILFVRQDNFMLVRAVYWVAKSDKIKYFDVKRMKKMGTTWQVREIHMTTKKGKKRISKTILHFDDIILKRPVNPNFFTTKQLEHGL